MALPKTRAEAKKVGSPRYLTGKLCKHGHASERRARDGVCLACGREKTNAWRIVNPDKKSSADKKYREINADAKRAKDVAYYAANKERMLARAKIYRIKTKEARLVTARKWAERNKDKTKAAMARYRRNNSAKINERASYRRVRCRMPLTAEQRAEIQALYAEARQLSTIAGKPYHVDHIIPLRGSFVSGLHVPWNLQILEGAENQRKGRKMLEHEYGL